MAAPLSNTTNGFAHPKQSQTRQSKSGISSYKREWEDGPALSQSSNVSWDTSPERVSKKSTNFISSGVASTMAGQSRQMTAGEKRLAAIQAALAETSSETSTQLSSSSTQVSSASTQVSSSTSSSKRSAPTSSSNMEPPSKKRTLPWDADHNALKAAQQKQSGGTAASASRSRATAPSGAQDVPVSVVSKVTLSNEQQHILKLIVEGKNVFFTGSAGTGKSVLLREVIRNLRRKHSRSEDAVAVTASTGIAACNIGGITLHSFSGAGFGTDPAETLATKIRKNRKSSTRWIRTQVLVIDEVSMVDGDWFDKLETIARLLRKSSKPFGGIQLIVTGDFFQLPPVSKGSSGKFAFEAQSWADCINVTFNLTQVFRQKDQEFIDMLNEMRFGVMSNKTVLKFKSLSRPIVYDDGIEPTELFPRREDVDRSNTQRMNQLSGQEYTFHSTDGGTILDVNQRKNMLSNFMACEQITLRINSQVMLIKNTDETLVNGSMGHVIGFYDPATFRQNTVTGEVDVVEENFDLSTLAGRKAAERKRKLEEDGAVLKYPLVRFPIPGMTGRHRDVLVQRETWKVETPSGEVQVSRTQLPLILAWAMSIHKSQGQTINRVRVDLKKVFEKGQAYVALSRATSLDGLQVLGFEAAKVQAHPKVIQWSKTLTTIA